MTNNKLRFCDINSDFDTVQVTGKKTTKIVSLKNSEAFFLMYDFLKREKAFEK